MNTAEWMHLLVNALAFVLFAASAALGLWRLKRAKQGATEAELAQLDRAHEILQGVLRDAAGSLVAKAEAHYGPGTGAIKKSAVLTELFRLLPAEWRTRFDAEELGELIETAHLRVNAAPLAK